MELSPQSVASTSFKTVKKGYDPAEVRLYLENLAKSIGSLQATATAMDARARAATARLQEIAAQPTPEPAPAVERIVEIPIDEAGTISRTLVLAQRTADTTVAEAIAEAQRITDSANSKCDDLVNSAQELASRLIEDAKSEARNAGEGQRVQIETEVQSLLVRREFLISDIDHLEQHTLTQRDRLRDVASSLTEIISATPGGLGDIQRPPLSAVGPDDSSEQVTVMFDDEVPPPMPEAFDADSTAAVDDSIAADDVGAGVVDQGDGTPPSGQSNQFLFEDPADEAKSVRRAPTDDDDVASGGDELP